MKKESFQHGCVTQDKRRGIWVFRWREGGRLRNKTLGPLDKMSKAKARTKAAHLALTSNAQIIEADSVPLSAVATRYIKECLPELKFSTRQAYRYNLENHIIAKWGDTCVTDLDPYAVGVWLKELPLSAKSQVHLRGLLRILLENAVLWKYISMQRNPMELVKIKGATKRKEEPTILTVEQFHALLSHMEKEPYRSMVLVAMSLGLRVSELLGLKWKDVDWENLKIKIERGVVFNHEDEVKTRFSRKPMPIEESLAATLKAWRAQTEFRGQDDWIWASPDMAGEKPYFYTTMLKHIKRGARAAGLGEIGWHTLRHSYRSWADEAGAPVGIQQRLMRHADFRTTMNQYGDVIPDSLRKHAGKLIKMAHKTA